MDTVDVVILAVGQGMGLRSAPPKVWHLLCGRPLLAYPLRVAQALASSRVFVVVDPGHAKVQELFSSYPVTCVGLKEPRGMGHAVQKVREYLSAPRFLVLPGHVPLLPREALEALVEQHRRSAALASFLSLALSQPGDYGWVVRDESGRPKKIAAAGDGSPADAALREVPSGIWCLENDPALWAALAQLSPTTGEESGLADLIVLLYPRVSALPWPHPQDLMGVSDLVDLARAERILRERILTAWMREGVSVVDPAAVYPGPDVRVGPDTVLLPGTFLYGETEIGRNCVIGPQAYVVDAKVGEGVRIWFSVVEGAWIAEGAQVGPYAHLRPGAHIGAAARIGNFVEVKASRIGAGVKALHLAYIGDAEVGPGANIGAGAITCNFQPGRTEKFRTEIGAGAFIGSNACLIAPIRIGEGAVVGAGSVITEDVPPRALALERSPQVLRPEWAKPAKNDEIFG